MIFSYAHSILESFIVCIEFQITMLGAILLITAVLVISFAFYKWAIQNNDFFKLRNIKYMKPLFFIGNTGGVYSNKYTAADFAQKTYRMFPNEP